ncbi:hypothetical protein BJX63DRAFT_445290 [Aspergillus granulosus]|uniref:HNH nuclease domain-containing protein n=1 Tax=Aspergillus granulosus TaxID=176169 RepID=A0ABR4H1W1_9EURO
MELQENHHYLDGLKKYLPDEIESLRRTLGELTIQMKNAEKKCKPYGSSNAEYWAAATEVAKISAQKISIRSDILFSEFQGTREAWERTDEGRAILEKIIAQQKRVDSFAKQRDTLLQPHRSLRASYIKHWTSSKGGLDITAAGTSGPRDSKIQSQFRAGLFRDYESLDRDGNAWCPVLGMYVDSENVVASHFFPWRSGQDDMDAIFGKIRPSELFSSRNGIILSNAIERAFEKGVLVIVPDLPEPQTKTMVDSWVNREIRDYKLQIIDQEWEGRERYVDRMTKFKDLDGKKLIFKGTFRPAARYVYFHYCSQILRQSWRKPSIKATSTLEKELGKPYWGTQGRYIRKNMLQALIEEVGHDPGDLLHGAKRSGGKDSLLVDTIAEKVAAAQDSEELIDEDKWSEKEEETSIWDD